MIELSLPCVRLIESKVQQQQSETCSDGVAKVQREAFRSRVWSGASLTVQ